MLSFFKKKFNRTFLVSLFFSIALLPSCTYFDPMVGAIKRPSIPDADKSKMPSLTNALDNIELSINQLENKRDNNISTSRVLDVATFGLGVGAAGYALRQGHSSAIKNLAFGAGSTYVASTLFSSNDQTLIYNAGVKALSCISQKGDQLRTIVVKYEKDLSTSDYIDSCFSRTTAYTRAVNAKEKAKQSLNFAKDNDSVAASQVTAAAQNVINNVNEQVINHSNNPDAVLNSAKSLTSFVSANWIKATNTTSQPPVPGPHPAACEEAILNNEIERYAAIEQTITAAINVEGSLDQACTVEAVSINPITLTPQSEITVKSGNQYFITINGGRPPYDKSISQTVDGLSIQLLTNTLVITGLKTLPTQDVIVDVWDSSTISAHKSITVHALP